jgi:hypothetical protein
MRLPLLVGALAAASLHGHLRATTASGDCYVVEGSFLVDDGADYRFHRIVIAGIRKVQAAADTSFGTCQPRDAQVIAAMRRAVNKQLDSVTVRPPTVRSDLALRFTSLAAVQTSIASLAARARDHAGQFSRVEVVSLPASETVGTDELSLPRLAADSADAAACVSANGQLAHSHASFRWAC